MATIETNTVENKSTKIIKYGSWNFEYSQKGNIYSSDIESFDNNKFNHFDSKTIATDKHQLELTDKDLDDFRRAATIHKIVRKKALSMICSGTKVADLVDTVENLILKLCAQNPLTYYIKGSEPSNSAGIAFPVGVNINNVVAHDSKTISIHGIVDDRKFFKGDVVKIDIGVHINGRIIDSAFTHIVTDIPGVHDTENIYNSVLEASRESMFSAIKLAGPDQRLYEISETIDEIIQSYEINIGGDILPIKAVDGIGGHNIKHYQIHGGKLVLCRPNNEIQENLKMEEDEIYAIETYATTGYGTMTQNDDMNQCTHYMEAAHDAIESNKKITKNDKRFFRQTELYSWLQTRKGLPYSSAWINTKTVPKLEKAYKLGIPSGQLIAYPPLTDEANSVVAQFEHTIHVNDGSVEIFSLGEDY